MTLPRSSSVQQASVFTGYYDGINGPPEDNNFDTTATAQSRRQLPCTTTSKLLASKTKKDQKAHSHPLPYPESRSPPCYPPRHAHTNMDNTSRHSSQPHRSAPTTERSTTSSESIATRRRTNQLSSSTPTEQCLAEQVHTSQSHEGHQTAPIHSEATSAT